MTKDDALKIAIEAMQTCDLDIDVAIAIYACKEALQPDVVVNESLAVQKPLSDEEKLEIIRKWSEAESMRIQDLIGLCDLIEKAHGIGE